MENRPHVTIGDNAQGVVIGDNAQVTQVFGSVSDAVSTTLQDLYIRPEEVYSRVHAHDVVGRDWLTARIDSFLQHNNRGVFILEGAAGVGKTACLASLVLRRNYIHLFSEQSPGLAGLLSAQRSLLVQLILRGELTEYTNREMLPKDIIRPDFLLRLLELARAKYPQGEKLVIVIDALDEAGTPYGYNVLGLPRTLPIGVYLLVSKRPVTTVLTFDDVPIHYEILEAQDSENLEDMRKYLMALTLRSEIQKCLATNGFSRDQFADELLSRSQGIWIYLHYLINDLAQDDCSTISLDALPTGLAEYYARKFYDWRQEDSWPTIVAPLWATLAAIQEPVEIQRLTEWAGVNAGIFIIRQLLEEKWRPYLAIYGEGEHRTYRLYHRSLQDFLEGSLKFVGRAAPYTGLMNLQVELSERTRSAHTQIAKWMQSRCRGHWHRLADTYGMRYVVTHLAKANRWDQVSLMLSISETTEKEVSLARPPLVNLIIKHLPSTISTRLLENWLNLQGHKVIFDRQKRTLKANRISLGNVWAEAKRQFEGGYAGFLNDVDQLWRNAIESRNIGSQIRCALIQASIRSKVDNIPPDLLAALVRLKHRMWTPALGLEYARQTPDPENRLRSLQELLPLVAVEQQTEIWSEILDTALLIKNSSPWYRSDTRTEELVKLIPHIPFDLLRPIWLEIEKKGNNHSKVHLLLAIIDRVDEGQRSELIKTMLYLAIITDWDGKLLATALACAGHIIFQDLVEQLLNTLLLKLSPNDEQKQVIVESILQADYANLTLDALVNAGLDIAALGWESDSDRVAALSEIVKRLPARRFSRVLAVIKDLKSYWCQADALEQVAPYLPSSLRGQALIIALNIPNDQGGPLGEEPSSSQRAKALAGLIPILPESQLEQVYGAVLELKGDWNRIDALTALAIRFKKRRDDFVEKVFGILRKDWWGHREEQTITVLRRLSPLLASVHQLPALELVRGFQNPIERARGLALIAPYINPAMRSELLDEALLAVDIIGDHKQSLLLTQLALASHISSELMPAVRERFESLSDRYTLDKSKVASDIGPKLTDNLLSLILEKLTIHDGDFRSPTREYWLEFLPYCSAEQLKHVAKRIKRVSNKARRGWLLAVFANYQPQTQRIKLQSQALSLINTVRDGLERASALASVLPHLAEELYPTAKKMGIQSVRSLKWLLDDQLRAISTLAAYIPAENANEILSIALSGTDDRNIPKGRVRAVTSLIPYLPIHLYPTILDAMDSFGDDSERRDILSALADHLPAELLTKALAQLFEVEPTWEDETLSHYVPALAVQPDLVLNMLESPANSSRTTFRAISKLSEPLAQLGHRSFIPSLVKVIGHRHRPAVVAKLLDRHSVSDKETSSELLEMAFESIDRLDANERVDYCLQLTPHLEEPRLSSTIRYVITAARELEPDDYTTKSLMRRLAVAWLEWSDRNYEDACQAFENEVKIIASYGRHKLASHLRSLAPLIVSFGGESAATEVFRAADDVMNWWP